MWLLRKTIMVTSETFKLWQNLEFKSWHTQHPSLHTHMHTHIQNQNLGPAAETKSGQCHKPSLQGSSSSCYSSFIICRCLKLCIKPQTVVVLVHAVTTRTHTHTHSTDGSVWFWQQIRTNPTVVEEKVWFWIRAFRYQLICCRVLANPV